MSSPTAAPTRLAGAAFAEGHLPVGPLGSLPFTDIPRLALRYVDGPSGGVATWWAAAAHANGLAAVDDGRVVVAQHGASGW